MRIQIPCTLHQRLRMGVDRPYLFLLRTGHSQQTMFDPDDLFPDNIILKLHQQIIDLTDDSRRGILDRQHREVRPPFLDGAHGLPKGIHMKGVHALPEILHHRHLGIGALRALKNHPGLICLQRVHTDKRQPAARAMGRQLTVLQLTAHGHDLLKKLLYPVRIAFIVHKRPHFAQLLFFSGLVQHISARLYLIIRHLGAVFHALLVELHDLPVDAVQFFPQFR